MVTKPKAEQPRDAEQSGVVAPRDMHTADAVAWRIEWDFGRAEVQALGAMLGPVTFRLDAGRELEAMHVANWAGQADASDLPGVLKRLRGEWPCVPFGRTDVPDDLPAGWLSFSADDAWPHGYGANNLWTCDEAGPRHVALSIDYPESSPVGRLERRISADPLSAALDIELTIHPRTTLTLPVGLHPTFRLPGVSARVRLDLAGNEGIFTYPSCDAGTSAVLQPDARGASLDAMPGLEGAIDLSRLPLSMDVEELLQVRGLRGNGERAPLSLHYLDHDARVDLWWDTEVLPDLMLWVSNRGRCHFPWQGRHVALGAEPVNSVFDLGRIARPPLGHALSDRRGVPLTAGQPWTTRYRLAAHRVGA